MKTIFEKIQGDYKNYLVVATVIISLLTNAGMLVFLDSLSILLALRLALTLNFFVIFIFSWVFTTMFSKKYYEQRQLLPDSPQSIVKKTNEHVKYTIKNIEDMITKYHNIDKKECDKVYFTLQLNRIKDSLFFILTTNETDE